MKAQPVECRRGRATVFGPTAVSQNLFQPYRYPFRGASSLEVLMAHTAATNAAFYVYISVAAVKADMGCSLTWIETSTRQTRPKKKPKSR
jgi:hypothetical protein